MGDSVRNALSIIDGKLESLFDALDLEIYNGDLSEEDVDKAIKHYGLSDVWEEWKDYN